MLSPVMFDSIFDIEAFLCPAAMSYQGLPGATRSHQESPRATKGHQKPPGLTKSHQELPRPPAATRSHWRHQERHQESPGAARSHKEPPGLTEDHQEPPGLFHDIAAPGPICKNFRTTRTIFTIKLQTFGGLIFEVHFAR